jgi:hypothetical protein
MSIRQLLASSYRLTMSLPLADGEAKNTLRGGNKPSSVKSGIRAFLADSGASDAWLDHVASDVSPIWHAAGDACDGHSHWDVD